MVHDFAKIRPEPILEKRAMESPPAWSLLFTGLVTGAAIGVFGCFLLYLSGNVPALPGQSVLAATPVQSQPVATAAQISQPEATPEAGEEGLKLEFYNELPSYEVTVDATPVELEQPAFQIVERQPPAQPSGGGYMLQAGAFQQLASADRQKARLEGLGLHAVVKLQGVTGGTLHLVQTGPFHDGQQLADVEALLNHNSIPSLRIQLD